MDDTLRTLLILIPGLPLAAAVLTAMLGPRLLRQYSHLPTVGALAGSLLCSLLLVGAVHTEQTGRDQPTQGGFERVYSLWTWASVGQAYDQPAGDPAEAAGGWRDFHVDIALRADSLTAIMLATVTFVSLLVALFSVGYMHGDPGYWRYFSYISLFVFSMTMLVAASNFVLLYVFWEAVGVCSYLLIGYWYPKRSASSAGMKAFLVNRVGDFGFALALFLIWTTYGTLDFHDRLAGPSPRAPSTGQVAYQQAEQAEQPEQAGQPLGVLSPQRIQTGPYLGGGTGLAICLLLLLGACGKSAQFPLHVWLPDAMEGPTPVSALIHAATMVTAGVYMVARCTPLFMASPDGQLAVAAIGALTAVLAALIALTQFDLKRVLAYSTVSQLGFMFLALGTGTLAGITAGMFHLFTHAFFKALLFLGAGSVMHAMGNVIDMRHFSGLRRLLPHTHWTFAFGCLALAGIVPFAGFWSKDAVVASVYDKAAELGAAVPGEAAPGEAVPGEAAAGEPVWDLTAGQRGGIYQGLFYTALLTAFLTAFYTFRAFYMTFYGEERIPPEAEHHAHESPPVMLWPLVVLAAGSLLVGAYFELTHGFADFLRFTPSLAAGAVAETQPPQFHFTLAVVSTLVAVAGVGAASYLYLGDRLDLERLTRLLQFGGRPKVASPYQLSYNKFFIDEIYDLLIVRPLRGLAALSYAVDRWIIDGLVDAVGRVPPAAGGLMRSLQTGLVQFYALAMVLAVVILMAAKLFWMTS